MRWSRIPTLGDATEPSVTEPSVAGASNPGTSSVNNDVFSMLKSYLEVKLDEKTKQISWVEIEGGDAGYSHEGNQEQLEPA